MCIVTIVPLRREHEPDYGRNDDREIAAKATMTTDIGVVRTMIEAHPALPAPESYLTCVAIGPSAGLASRAVSASEPFETASFAAINTQPPDSILRECNLTLLENAQKGLEV